MTAAKTLSLQPLQPLQRLDACRRDNPLAGPRQGMPEIRARRRSRA